MAEGRIPLSDLIAELRCELALAEAEGEASDLQFLVKEAEMELQQQRG